MLNVSSLVGARPSRSDALRYGQHRDGETTPDSALTRRPVVVWNVTRQCNLACAHCYASAKRRPAQGELTTGEARRMLADLAAFGVPAVLVSGGEPLSREDLLDLVVEGTARGLRFTLSSNGTLIDASMARRIAEARVVYVGISVDGTQATHDRFRRQPGAFDQSLAGLRALGDAGVKRGVRFTLSPSSLPDLDAVLDLVVREGIERFCLYHLVPSGRGAHLHDVSREQRRGALERVFGFAAAHPGVEVLTVDNPSDAAVLHAWLAARDAPAADRARRMLEWNTGARGGPGVGIGCIDEVGLVHPDQFSRHLVLGSVRATPFSALWTDAAHPRLRSLREHRPLPAACGDCAHRDICGGGLRTRAELSTGDPWGFDPSCGVRAA